MVLPTTCRVLFAALAALFAVSGRLEAEILADSPLPEPARQGMAVLESAVRARPVSLRVIAGIAGQSALLDRTLAEHGLTAPQGAESLLIKNLPDGTHLLAGGDARGLNYALREAARALELGAPVRDAAESPFLRTRSLSVHLHNRDLEAAWYFEEAFWRDYLALLAGSRFNHLILTFADQTNYLCPPYPSLIAVPGYPQVTVEGLTAAAREKNLAMLRRIAELAQEYGLDFSIGIWMQAPVKKYVGAVEVRGLPEGLAAADYCAAGLGAVLRACPSIDGVQFRMNAESGVAEAEQRAFYAPLFRAIRDAGRPLRLELRFKGLRPETIAEARSLGLDTVVSTKFWAEHLGLPYHPAVADSHYRADRYSFGSLLTKPRDYRVSWQLWNVGTQRLLLWGDPDYAARFAAACRLGEGDGFEVFAPLTDRGFGNAPGNWPLFVDPKRDAGRWHFERHWFFHLCFGRMGYDPQTEPEVWRREFRHRFGESAESVEKAFASASRILPLVTATRLPSASEWSWWPEMDTGDALPEYARTQPSDTSQFYAIRSWKPTPQWRFEEWDADIPGFVEDAVAGRVGAKTSPVEVSLELSRLAKETEAALAGVSGEIDPDLRVLAALGEFHAAKTLAAVDWAFFDETGDRKRLPRALAKMREAESAWEKIVALTEGVYHDNLVFGYGREHQRKGGYHQTGHWRDRLAGVRDDVAMLEALVKDAGAVTGAPRVFPGEEPAERRRAGLEHRPVEAADAGKDLTVRVTSRMPLRDLVLRYRPLNQVADWKAVTMRDQGAGGFEATIPGGEIGAEFDLQYYLEATMAGGGGEFWPSRMEGPPYVVVKTR